MQLFEIVGFTGTQRGMTPEQKNEFKSLIEAINPVEFHHGDCIGADEQAHYIVADTVDVVIHPPIDPKKRAFCQGTTLTEKPFLKRNHDIVDAASVLIAAPGETNEVLRSGTWATIRYAHKTNTRTIIIYPDGSVRYT
jgi:hypothetical protein